jgi:uncharacterized protein (TIGR03000 family)
VSNVVDMRRFWLALAAVVSCCSLVTAQEAQPTLIMVSLPADAQLEVNGRLTSSTGATREFRDSQTRPGGVYRYVLRASIEREGRTISQERLVRLYAGDTEHVNFQFVQPVVARKELAAPPVGALAQATTFQPRFQPRTTESGQLPDLPPNGDEPDGSLPPIATDDGNLSTENDLRTTQPAVPALDTPATDGSRFGRQFGDETDEPAPADNELPPLGDEPALGQPRFDTPPTTTEPQPEVAKSLTEKPTVDQSDASSGRPLAYLGHDHIHQFFGNSGTALHVWQHRWRMVRLEHVGESGPYSLYREIDQRGYDWAYGRLATCSRQVPVFFKPGSGAAWCFVGYAERVRPFPN